MTTTFTHPVVAGAGPVGRAVAGRLVELGHRPTVITRSGAAVDGADARAHDLHDPADAVAALEGASVVFQCAQPAYHRWPEEFPALQRSVLAACESVGSTLIVMENLYGYGRVDEPMTEDLPLAATNRKGSTRALMCEELISAHRSGRVATASVRASDFFGPGVQASAYGERFVPPIVQGRRAQLLGRPDALHSVTYVPDIAEAMVRIAADPASWGRAWHVPSAPATTQIELVRRFAEAAGTDPRWSRVPTTALRLVGLFDRGARETVEMLYEFEQDFVIDSSAFEERFGVSATPLDESIAATVAAASPSVVA